MLNNAHYDAKVMSTLQRHFHCSILSSPPHYQLLVLLLAYVETTGGSKILSMLWKGERWIHVRPIEYVSSLAHPLYNGGLTQHRLMIRLQ